MKKKIIAVSLITAMVICNSMTVWAADSWKGDQTYEKGETGTDNADRDSANVEGVDLDKNSGQKDVKGSIDLGQATDSYSVDISWGALTYDMNTTGVTNQWSASDGYYIISNCGGWTATDAANGSDKITVTNKSNVGITASLQGTMDTATASLYGISDGKININNSVTKTLLLPASTSSTGEVSEGIVSVEGTVTKSPSLKQNDIQLGTVTITIEKTT